MKNKTNLIIDKKLLSEFDAVYALDFDGVFSENYFSVGISRMKWVSPALKSFVNEFPHFFSCGDGLPAMRDSAVYGIQLDSLQKIVQLCEETNGAIVVVSSWVHNDDTALAFQALIDYLFPTDDRGPIVIGSTNGSSGSVRERDFFNWLSEFYNEPIEVLAIDDSASIFFPVLSELNRVINVNSRNGFVTDDFIAACKKVSMPNECFEQIAKHLDSCTDKVASKETVWKQVTNK